jgi:LAO/AO transport system kinase
MRDGDKRALARLMTYVDNRHEDLLEILSELSAVAGRAFRIGVTGPPGAGKSTLVDKLIACYRAEGKTVGVVAIDPSSPFSGGAVLGDRIRMQDHNADEGVFIRSLGSRGAHGGLSRAARDIVHLFDAFGFDVVLIETVGVGQTELDIMSVADTTLVVLVPESGDTIQTMKAGLMEIADVFVVNKADREGADRIFFELKALSQMHGEGSWEVPVLKAVATKYEGIEEIVRTISAHRDHLSSHPKSSGERAEILKRQLFEVVLSEIAHRLDVACAEQKPFREDCEALVDGRKNAYQTAADIVAKIKI